MTAKIQFIESEEYNPYQNLAVEKYLFDTVESGTVILYLWQNDKTVVYGRNQNVWKECNISKLLGGGGYPARRLSGGGAVYHDMGNLNFTFLAQAEDYDVEKQLSVILTACRKCGIFAEKTGRNDITVDGRKFSGNAFYKVRNRRYHHGTLLINSEISALSGYLTVDPEKLKSKGITSVKSRVINLQEIMENITVDKMKQALKEAFAEVYQLKTERLSVENLDKDRIAEYASQFQTEDWLYGRRIPFAMRIYRRFSWGDFDLNLDINHGKINEVRLYSDAIDGELIEQLQEKMKGQRFAYKILIDKIRSLEFTQEQERIVEDIEKLLFESI